MKDLKSRVAFITGGANGIGLGIARAFAKEGVRLALADLDEAALDAAKSELSAKTDVETFILDVRDREAFAKAVDEAEAKLGNITLLINNAGVAGKAPIEKMTYQAWDWVIGINLNGVFNGIQTVLPRMLARKDTGHIVNTSSLAGLLGGGMPGVLYVTSKFGVVGMSESLRGDLKAHGIGVSVLMPGPIATDIVGRTDEIRPEGVLNLTPEEEEMMAEKRKASAEFIASGKSPDEVGEMVVAGIKANQLYIHTHRMFVDELKKRTDKILNTMPDE